MGIERHVGNPLVTTVHTYFVGYAYNKVGPPTAEIAYPLNGYSSIPIPTKCIFTKTSYSVGPLTRRPRHQQQC